MTEIKTLLKNARTSRGLFLKDVSKATGIPVTTIHGWERGAFYPRGKNRDVIAVFYGLPKDALDYPIVNADTDSRQFNIGQITQDMAMAEYETKPVMLHKKHWEMARAIQKGDDDVDLNQMFARLLTAAHASGKKT